METIQTYWTNYEPMVDSYKDTFQQILEKDNHDKIEGNQEKIDKLKKKFEDMEKAYRGVAIGYKAPKTIVQTGQPTANSASPSFRPVESLLPKEVLTSSSSPSELSKWKKTLEHLQRRAN